IERYKQPGAAAAWHFLSGDQRAIEHLTRAAGFRYAWGADPKKNAQPTRRIVPPPESRPPRVLLRIEDHPRRPRYAPVGAAAGKVGNPVDQLLLYCYHYDPLTGRYGLVIMRTIRVVAAGTVLALGAFIIVMVRREKTSTSHQPSAMSHP